MISPTAADRVRPTPPLFAQGSMSLEAWLTFLYIGRALGRYGLWFQVVDAIGPCY